MDIQIKLGDGAKLPVNAHESDTGYDVIAASEPRIGDGFDLEPDQFNVSWKRVDYIEYDTNITIAPESYPFGYASLENGTYVTHRVELRYGQVDIRPRSSISKYNLVLANSPATIDHSYRGTIKLRFKYVFQPEDLSILGGKIVGRVNMDKIYRKSDKIGQLVAAWKEPINWIQVDKLPETTRADGGFGSSGA